MIVAGVMSGTSADGINVALVRITPGSGRNTGWPQFAFLGHAEFPYPEDVRRFVLTAMNSTRAGVADLARLNFLLAELYAEAVLSTEKRFRRKAQLVGCHGQTIYHQGEAARFLGRELAVTWQTGDGSRIAKRVGVPVVSDFRPADMAAGGKGAPLVPFLDFLLYRHPRIGRIVQNIGGIANVTAIPAKASAGQVVAFDTGPGNMVIDAVMERLYGVRYDEDGKTAASGHVIEGVLQDAVREPFFRRKPPKTAGREEFGREFANDFIRQCGRTDGQNVVATATALTAMSVAQALRDFVLKPRASFSEFIVSGGGAKNPTLMAMLVNELQPLGLGVRSSDEFGLPAEAKEAAAFALLAYQTWKQKPSNLPSATGAKRPAILGKISYA
jgi:anhydro-N-acetylmuramic acid kinase